MSNRDGRTAKRSKENFRKGQLCPRCRKGHFEKADCCGKPGHGRHVICNTCHHSNF